MVRSTIRFVVGAVFVVMVASSALAKDEQGKGNAETSETQGNQPTITAATLSSDRSTIFVEGVNFGKNPIVTLDEETLGGIRVDQHGRRLTAVMRALDPGTYRLIVINQTAGKSSVLHMTIAPEAVAAP